MCGGMCTAWLPPKEESVASARDLFAHEWVWHVRGGGNASDSGRDKARSQSPKE